MIVVWNPTNRAYESLHVNNKRINMARYIACKHCRSNVVVNRTSKFRDVDYFKKTIDKQPVQLGYFKSKKETSLAYDAYVLANNIIDRPLNIKTISGVIVAQKRLQQ